VNTPDQRAPTFVACITYLPVALTPVVMAVVLYADHRSWASRTPSVLFGAAWITDF